MGGVSVCPKEVRSKHVAPFQNPNQILILRHSPEVFAWLYMIITCESQILKQTSRVMFSDAELQSIDSYLESGEGWLGDTVASSLMPGGQTRRV